MKAQPARPSVNELVVGGQDSQNLTLRESLGKKAFSALRQEVEVAAAGEAVKVAQSALWNESSRLRVAVSEGGVTLINIQSPIVCYSTCRAGHEVQWATKCDPLPSGSPSTSASSVGSAFIS